MLTVVLLRQISFALCSAVSFKIRKNCWQRALATLRISTICSVLSWFKPIYVQRDKSVQMVCIGRFVCGGMLGYTPEIQGQMSILTMPQTEA